MEGEPVRRVQLLEDKLILRSVVRQKPVDNAAIMREADKIKEHITQQINSLVAIRRRVREERRSADEVRQPEDKQKPGAQKRVNKPRIIEDVMVVPPRNRAINQVVRETQVAAAVQGAATQPSDEWQVITKRTKRRRTRKSGAESEGTDTGNRKGLRGRSGERVKQDVSRPGSRRPPKSAVALSKWIQKRAYRTRKFCKRPEERYRLVS